MFLPLGGSSVILFPAHSRTLDRAFSSGGERFPDTEEVTSSNLVTPTKCSQLRGFASELFCFTPASQESTATPKAASTTSAIIPIKPKAAPAPPTATPTKPKVTSTPAQTSPTKPKPASAPPAGTPTKPKSPKRPCRPPRSSPNGPHSRIRTNHHGSRVNTFPRSERAKTDSRNIGTFDGVFPAVLLLESCSFDVEKCGCFRGPNKVVHFAEKYSPSI